jgi:hypothetical protein
MSDNQWEAIIDLGNALHEMSADLLDRAEMTPAERATIAALLAIETRLKEISHYSLSQLERA